MIILLTKYAPGQKHPQLVIAETAGTLLQYEEGAQAMNVQQIAEFQAMLDIYIDLLIILIEMISMSPCMLLHRLNLFQLIP